MYGYIIMSKNPPQIQFNFSEETPEELTLELKDNIEEQIEEEEEINLPDISKTEIVQEDVFEIPNKKEEFVDNLAVLPDELKEQVAEIKQVKLTKKGRPRKQMSDAHKEKLKFARERAIEVRRQNKVIRDEQKARDAEEKDLIKRKKEKEFQKLKKEVEEPVDVVKPEPKPEPVDKLKQVATEQPLRYYTLTQEQLEDLQFNAISKHEVLRKQRKNEKKQKEMIEHEKQNLINKLNPNGGYGARLPNGRLMNMYDSCY